tara:strand:+ start:37721 stop:38308 length:588 start_codon:yes stop_codon:yes gene_type:complete
MPEKSQYKSLAEWREANPYEYGVAKYNGWIDDIRKKFGWCRRQTKPKGYWTKEKCIKEAKKYQTKADWERSSSSSHSAARKNKWFDECCLHMKRGKQAGYWTKELCMIEAKKWDTISNWAKNSSSYKIAGRKGWRDECISHMKAIQKPNGYWTKERCIEEARKYKSKVMWRRYSSTACSKARKNGWVDECTKHMK